MRRISFLLLWFSAGVAAQAPTPHTPAGTPTPGIALPAKPAASDAPGTVHGRILAADTGNPLRGATVRISGNEPANAKINKTAVADRQGQYRIDGLLPGAYLVSVSRPGFIQMRAGERRLGDRLRRWTLLSSETRRLDFALQRGGVIAGRLTDETGEPLAGIRLSALRISHSPNGETLSANNPLSFASSTDDRGEFRVAGLSPGTYLLAAEHDSNEAGENLVTTYYPGTTNLKEAHRFRISVSELATANFSMHSGKLVRIAGVVQSSDGMPLQNARIALRSRTTLGLKVGRIEDASGAFDFAGVAPGDYTLDVSRTGMGGMPVFFKQTEFASVKLSVGAEDVTGLVITTGAGITVAGRAIYERSSSEPITLGKAQLNVQLMEGPTGMRSPSADPNNGVIANDGTFLWTGGFGKMLFRVYQPGWEMKSVTLKGVDITDVPYDASRGNVKDLEIVMTERRQLVTGTVVSVLGKPVDDYFVIVFPGALPEGAVPGRLVRFAAAQDDGTFRLVTLPAGDFLAAALKMVDPDIQYDPAFHEAVRDRATLFHLSPGETRKLELTLIE